MIKQWVASGMNIPRILQVCFFALLPFSAEAQTADQIREAQALLSNAGEKPGPIDGIWGQRTNNALIRFLADRGVEFDGELSENELEILRAAPAQSYTANGRPVRHRAYSDGRVEFPDSWELPQYLDPPPNDLTLSFYFKKWRRELFTRENYEIEPSGSATHIPVRSRPSAFLDEQLRRGSILSYLYYEDGVIIHDQLAPQERFTFQLDDDTAFRSQSVGKSLVSYIVGHAICDGYIESVDVSLGDWSLLQDTLYEEMTLLDVLNMRARDQHVVTEEGGFLETGRWFNNAPIDSFSIRELKGTEPHPQEVFNYHGFATNIALNYTMFRSGDEWQALLDRVFRDHVGIEGTLYFMKTRGGQHQGPGLYMFYAKRYDYLRIAVAMLEDWRNETCVGRYLQEIYERRQPMNHGFDDPNRMSDVAKSYGGQFLFDFEGMQDRTIFGLNGYGGQNVAIDMENGRIVVVNAAHTNFDWRRLVYEAVRDGGLPD